MLKVKTLALQALMAVAIVAANGCIINQDDPDGSGEGEGEGEGEEVTLLGAEESCNLTRTDEICDPALDLVCVQQGLNPNAGICRPGCGDNTTGEKDPSITCPSGTTCQVFLSADLTSASVVCAPQGARNTQCRALDDEEACVDGDCVILDFTADAAGTQIETVDALGCRVACDAAGTGTECLAGESCLEAGRLGFRTDFEDQLDAAGAAVTCTPALCDVDGQGCQCGADFECVTFGSGATAQNVCTKQKGMCLIPIDAFTLAIDAAEDLTGQFTPEKICNTVDSNKACDPRFFDGVTNPGTNECIQGLFDGNDGFCYAFCSSPSVDQNRNGTLEADETGEDFGCPTNTVCSLAFGRIVGLAIGVDDPATGDTKACNPATCPAGTPCPAQCGIGDTECVDFGTDGAFCLAPFGNCVDVAPVVNVAPAFTSLATGTVAENTAIATAIYTAVATDAGTITYSLKAATGDVTLLAINATSGAVTVATGTIDFETKPSYAFTVVATDNATPALFTELPVVITVTNVNEAPVFTSAATATTVEASIAAFYTALATDEDAGTTIAYSIKSGVGDAADFAIDAATGALNFVVAPVAATKSSYTVTLVATDNATTPANTELVLAITVTAAPN